MYLSNHMRVYTLLNSNPALMSFLFDFFDHENIHNNLYDFIHMKIYLEKFKTGTDEFLKKLQVLFASQLHGHYDFCTCTAALEECLKLSVCVR